MNFSAHVFLCYALWLMVLQAISSEENIYKKTSIRKRESQVSKPIYVEPFLLHGFAWSICQFIFGRC